MKLLIERIKQQPIILLIVVNILIGVFIYRDFGLSWDEPLFYKYADALGYAYSPHEWNSGHFDLEYSYGPSGEDHKSRGPAYILLARNFVYGFQALGSDTASAWHLVNFLFFQLGIYFLYRLTTRWVSPFASLLASGFFAYQPLLWGHAFINPKDPPFLTFFLAAVCLGFEMVDDVSQDSKINFTKIIPAAFVLGIATSIRVLGPLAGLIVLAHALLTHWQYLSREAGAGFENKTRLVKRNLVVFFYYAAISISVAILSWPYLWPNPLSRFVEVFRFMSDNPTELAVLFAGQIFRADNMPLRYIPFMLGATLTEPTWLLFSGGLILGIIKFRKTDSQRMYSLVLCLGWLIILTAYILIQRPAVYDGLRHFLFILPPIFVFSGFVFEWILRRVSLWLRAALVAAIILPGIFGILNLHPYEYAYYNAIVDGTAGAFRKYETDYWLTCYKDAVESLNKQINQKANLFVSRESYIAAYYANLNFSVIELRDAPDQIQSGDYLLVNSRTNDDRAIYRDAPPVVQVRRGDAIFCEIRKVP